MKKRVLIPSAAVSIFSCLVAYFLLIDSDVHAQERARVTGPNVKATAAVTKSENRAASYARAAAQNATLRNSLSWAFGGKTQTGWTIYVPLIAHTIGTESTPDSNEFALAVSDWQSRAGLPETGVLDRSTLETF